ncbi:hypothetical protein [Moraxella lincolnii]|uniref:hypothetical protein n=1 Tax=Lwoffella lincolnii TaxID=90241 RepID=UPI0030CE81ED
MLMGLSACEQAPHLNHLAINDHDNDGQANRQQANNHNHHSNQNNHHVVTITPTRVTLADEHIQNFKPERYQPHLTLYGRLLPKTQHLLKAEANWQIKEVFVKPNQWVKKGDVLLSYQIIKQPSIAPPPLPQSLPQSLIDDNDWGNINNNSVNDDSVPDANQTDPDDESPDNESSDDKMTNKTTHEDNHGANDYDDNTDNAHVFGDNGDNHITGEISDGDAFALEQDNSPPPERRTFAVGHPPPQKTPEIQATALKQITPSAVVSELLAPYTGQVMHSYLPYINKSTPLNQGQPLLTFSDTREFHFISILPEYTRSQISVGQVVNFSPQNTVMPIKMTGQIAKIDPISNKSLAVTITVIEDDKSRPYLKEGLWVQGKVDYGQIEVGTLVAKSAVMGADLSAFLQPHAHVAAPIKAYVWIINQDLTLTRQPIMVVRYDAQTQQYLVSGIPPEVLICLANLPKSAEGKVARLMP